MTLTTDYQYIGRTNMLSSHGGYGYYVLLYAKTTPDTARGVHTVGLKLRMACDVASSFYNWYSAGYARVGDLDALNWEMAYLPNKAWSSEALTEGGYSYPRWVDLAEGTAEVAAGYGAELSRTLTWGYQMLDVNSGAWFPQNGVWVRGSADVTLPAIPGATVPEVPAGAVMGQALEITLTPVNGAYRHTLTYTFGTKTGTIGENLTGTVSWTPPPELAEAIPSAREGTLQIHCVTLSGTTRIGVAQTVKLPLSVPDSLAPAVSATWSDTSGAMDKAGSPVQLVSKIAVEGDVTTQYGAAVKSTSVTLNGKTYSGSALTEAGDLILKLTVTDSRGLTGVWEERVTVLPYQAPTVRIDASRWSAADESGVADDMGEYARVIVSGTISDVPGNAGTLTLTAGNFQENREISGDFGEVFYISAPSAASMKLSAAIQDDYMSAESAMTLSVGYATMDFLEGGKGIAFGTTAQEEGFECAMPARFTGGVHVGGSPVADFVTEEGTSGYWKYRKWNSGTVEAWSMYSSFNLGSGTVFGSYGYLHTASYYLPDGLFSAKPPFGLVNCDIPAAANYVAWKSSASEAVVWIFTTQEYSSNNNTTLNVYLRS